MDSAPRCASRGSPSRGRRSLTEALTLAEAHAYPDLQKVLSQYAAHLLEQGKRLRAVELYRKANQHTDAAKLLNSTLHEHAVLPEGDAGAEEEAVALSRMLFAVPERGADEAAATGRLSLAALPAVRLNELTLVVSPCRRSDRE